MEIVRLSFFIVIGFVASISGQYICDDLLTKYCRCIENPDAAMQVYQKTYQLYHNHISELRQQIRSNFGSEITNLLKGKCQKNLCKYLENYEDVLITRCEHCLLGCEYEPFWNNTYREKEEDVCAWIVIHGPPLCGQVHEDHECDFKTYLHETFFAFSRVCNGERCQ